MSRFKKLFSVSNSIALLALFFALGGSVYAATGRISGTQIKPGSIPGNRLRSHAVAAGQIKEGAVGSAQIKAGAVGAKQIKSGSITASQVKPGSLTGAQIKGSTLAEVSAANIQTVQYVGVTVALVREAQGGTSGTASCPSGMKVIGGGASTTNPRNAYVNESFPTADRNGWSALAFSGVANATMTVTAICTAVAAPTG